MASTRTADPEAAFHRRIGARNLAALWVARRGMDVTRPASRARPTHWRFDDIRPAIMEAGALVAAEDAFRRVLVLENESYPGEMRATDTLYAGLQLVLPGEIAPCHRHSQTAIRFVVEGEGAYTSVEGERTRLRPGDFVVTPRWTWHDHVNEGEGPVIWLDVLDTPLVGALDTVFRETAADALQPIVRPEGDSPARYGAGMRPFGPLPDHAATPVFSYAYDKARAALEGLREAGGADPRHGYKMRYIDPTTGRDATPTMAAFLQLLPAGFAGAPCRASDGAVYCVKEGTGETEIEGETIAWRARDVFAVPGWKRHRHRAETDAVLFSVSDQAAQRALGLWREEAVA